jgi:hypothetical protein
VKVGRRVQQPLGDPHRGFSPALADPNTSHGTAAGPSANSLHSPSRAPTAIGRQPRSPSSRGTVEDASGGGLRLGDGVGSHEAHGNRWLGWRRGSSPLPPSQDKPSRPGPTGRGRSSMGRSTSTRRAWPASPPGWDEGRGDDPASALCASTQKVEKSNAGTMAKDLVSSHGCHGLPTLRGKS